MFNFGNNKCSSKTGFFRVKVDSVIEIPEVPGNGSINSCIQSLGFPINHIVTIHTFDSDKINCLGFKALSKEIVFLLAASPQTKISYSDVKAEIDRIDWSFEYSSLRIEEILQEGINLENLDLDFLKSVVELKTDSENLYKSEQLGLYLQFENNILKAFTSNCLDSSSTKWLNDLNPEIVQSMKEEARRFHRNDLDAMEEVNRQTDAILEVPFAFKNEYLGQHIKESGNINFYNLLVTHYSKPCTLDDILFINKGRLRKINEFTIEVGNYIYTFNPSGELASIISR